MTIQLLQSIRLVFIYLAERASGNDSEMILQKSYQWFESINIQYAVGVDGISVLMILLTGIIIFTGIFTSWKSSFHYWFEHNEVLENKTLTLILFYGVLNFS